MKNSRPMSSWVTALLAVLDSAALFLVLEKVTPDKAVEAMSKYGGTVLKTSLSKDDEKELQDALHGSQPAAQ